MSRKLRLPAGMPLVNLLCGGWTVLIFLFLYIPIVLLIIYSFNESKLNILWTGFTLDWYRKLWGNKPLLDALRNSVIIASITTVISVALGTAGAWLLYRYHYPAARMLNTLIFVPMVVPEIIMGISLLIFFTSVSVPLNRLLEIEWLYNTCAWVTDHLNQCLGTSIDPDFGLGFTTVIIAHTTFCFPFVLVSVQARLAGVDPSLEEAALDLGAPPLKAFWLVMVPYLMPAIISGALLSFTLSMDEVIVTYFTASPASATLPMKVYGMAKVGLNPMLNAISTVFILATVILVVLAEFVRKSQRT